MANRHQHQRWQDHKSIKLTYLPPWCRAYHDVTVRVPAGHKWKELGGIGFALHNLAAVIHENQHRSREEFHALALAMQGKCKVLIALLSFNSEALQGHRAVPLDNRAAVLKHVFNECTCSRRDVLLCQWYVYLWASMTCISLKVLLHLFG